jgi:3-oxoacyl-[acyl-carrier protein] reductase
MTSNNDSVPIPLPPNGSFSFVGRVALVTGAARGIGEAIARELHIGGARVAIADVAHQAAMAVANSLDPSHASAMALELDVRDKTAFERARDSLERVWGGTDIVVNNAGLGKRTPTPDITPAEFDEIVAINMRSVFFSCQVFGDYMRMRRYGRIVNITSLAGQNGGTVASAHYAASKAGAIMLTKYFGKELAGAGVTVNAVSPGPIATAKARLSAEQIAAVQREVPVGRFGEATEIAAAVALLASDRGGFFTGATLDVNGGLYLR